MEALSLMATASPPASSNEELMREPLESLFRLLCRLVFVFDRL
jgi:hypothetical protein